MPKRFPALFLYLLLTALLIPVTANAAGFAIYEWGARGQALSGAMVGRADDPSALAYNPAGMTQLEGKHTMAGVTAIMPSTKVTLSGGFLPNTVTTETEDNVYLPPHAFLTWQLNDHYWLGLGIFSRFGLGNEYDPAWPGRYQVYDVSLETLSVNPNLAIKLTDKLSGSIGLEGMWMSLAQKNKIRIDPSPIPNPATDVDLKLEADSIGYGINLGVHYRATDWLRLGASYRSEIRQDADGDAKYGNVNPLLVGLFPNTDISGTIILPATFMVGAAVYPTDRLSIEANVMLMQWSSYESLDITFAEGPGGTGPNFTDPRRKNWKDVWRYQIGLEYKATDWLDLRIGYIFDEDPIDPQFADFLLPTNDRHFLNLGAGFNWAAWNVDVAYSYMYVTERDNVTVGGFNARFHDGNAHKVGLSVGYAF
jgi:long-chain fatty acid transport protein